MSKYPKNHQIWCSLLSYFLREENPSDESITESFYLTRDTIENKKNQIMVSKKMDLFRNISSNVNETSLKKIISQKLISFENDLNWRRIFFLLYFLVSDKDEKFFKMLSNINIKLLENSINVKNFFFNFFLIFF